jgi:hypothetical protein
MNVAGFLELNRSVVGALAVVSICVLLVVLRLRSELSYYRALYSEASLREFYDRLSKGIEAARQKGVHGVVSLDDGTAFVTSFGICTCVSWETGTDGNEILRVSLSQRERMTTSAVCSRFGFFVIAMLGLTEVRLTPFFSESGIRYLDFQLSDSSLNLQPFGACFARFLKDYEPIFFKPVVKRKPGAEEETRSKGPPPLPMR